MSNLDERLARCLALVLPAVQKGELEQASSITVRGWDSLATVTLVSMVEEEFGIEVPFEELENFLSFQGMRAFLMKTTGAR